MSSNEQHTHESPTSYAGDGGRPEVEKYDINSKLRPNDQVYILSPRRRGPFTVRQVRNGKCTLIDDNGAQVDQGKWFNEDNLELDD